MKTKRLSLLPLLFTCVVCLAANAKPKIRIIATGGTIAGVSTSATNSAYYRHEKNDDISGCVHPCDGGCRPGR